MANNPELLKMPLARDGQKSTIPETTDASTGLFSQRYGWQSINSLPPQAGGKAVKREDFNGAFNLLGGVAFMAQKGFTFKWSAEQDYYAGCVVTDDTDGLRYECIADVTANGTAPSADATHWRLFKMGTDIDAWFRQASTVYAVGDMRCYESLPYGWYLECTTAGTTAETDIDMTGVADGSSITDGTVVWMVHDLANSGSGSPPNYYVEDDHWTTADRTKLQSPSELWLNINGKTYKLKEAVTIDTRDAAAWDTKAEARIAKHAYAVGEHIVGTNTAYIYECTTAGTTSTHEPTLPETVGETYNDGSVVWTCHKNPATAANRAGTDAYIYAVATDTLAPAFVLSENSTVPAGYTADNSRKVGGFHCLCVDVGTISGHALTGYVAGDILPASVWDCEHRPISSPEGMVYSEECDKWFDIYLTSYTGTIADGDLAVQSVYGATTADGTSGVTFHWYTFAKYYKKARKMMMNQEEFMSISTGSNQGTNIAGSAYVGKTGGYKDTAGRRMISNIGCEDCCGNLWQRGIETGDTNTGNSWSNAYGGSDDASQLGQGYQVPSRALFGGGWDSGARCGSRGSDWLHVPLTSGGTFGSRACAEPLHRSA